MIHGSIKAGLAVVVVTSSDDRDGHRQDDQDGVCTAVRTGSSGWLTAPHGSGHTARQPTWDKGIGNDTPSPVSYGNTK
jgi:hypothetical protein